MADGAEHVELVGGIADGHRVPLDNGEQPEQIYEVSVGLTGHPRYRRAVYRRKADGRPLEFSHYEK